MLLGLQLRHSLALGPLHVAHEGEHGWQTLGSTEAFPQVPSGVHSAKHTPTPPVQLLWNGELSVQEVHSTAMGPLHVPHEEWHGMQVSDPEPIPAPARHVKPGSTVHISLHPSNATLLPSSHASVPARRPSPHSVVHVSFVLPPPPMQLQPNSTSHSSLHPSPLFTPPSSHSSLPTRRPSPQMGTHVTLPPRPLPKGLFDVHAYPCSTLQSASHPSSPAVFPSSQPSLLLSRPSPHTCTAAFGCKTSAVVVFSTRRLTATSSVSVNALALPGLEDDERPSSSCCSLRGVVWPSSSAKPGAASPDRRRRHVPAASLQSASVL